MEPRRPGGAPVTRLPMITLAKLTMAAVTGAMGLTAICITIGAFA